jgi:hypothetical protein
MNTCSASMAMHSIFTLLILLHSDVKTNRYNRQTQHTFFATNSYVFKQAIVRLYKETKM